MEYMRKTMLPSIYLHKNFMIVENENKEEDPIVTKEKICKISKKQCHKIYHILVISRRQA